MSSTLVLNADMNPVSVVPLSTIHWQEAVRILVTTNAEGNPRATALENYDKWVVRSPSIQLKMPSVIMLTEYKHHNGKVEFSRQNVILRDKYTCQYCQVVFPFHELTFDHVIPRRDKGKTDWENIASACYDCNQKKAHHRTMKPMTVPRRPTYWELAKNRKLFPINIPNADWIPHLGWEGKVNIIGSKEHKNVDSYDDSLPFFGE